MPSLDQLALFKQRSVEQLFAAVVYFKPLEAVQLCGWFLPSEIQDERVHDYWSKIKEFVKPEMDDQAVREYAISAAFEAGLMPDLMGWTSDIGWNYEPRAYASEISRRNYISRLGQGLGKLAAAISTQDDQLARQIVSEMNELRPRQVATIPDAMSIAGQFNEAVVAGKRSVDTFIPPLDVSLGGLERQTLTILAGRPSMGKTALALQIARNVAASCSKVLFFSLEMSSVSLWGRIACPLISSTWRDVRAGKLTQQQEQALLAKSYEIAASMSDNFLVIDTPQTTESAWRTVAEQRPALVIADHLRLFRDKGDSEVKRQGMIAENLKGIAKAFNVPVLCAAQLSRALEGRQEKRPQLSDLRDSGEIEEVADVVLMMYRDSYYSPANGKPDKTEIWIRKFRDGPMNGCVNLHFDAKQEWFEPL